VHGPRCEAAPHKGAAILLDSISVKAQPNDGRDANAKRLRFQSNLSTGTLVSVPFPRSEARRAKGNRVRALVERPPSARRDAELLLKPVVTANRILDFENQIFVCAKYRRELSCLVRQ